MNKKLEEDDEEEEYRSAEVDGNIHETAVRTNLITESENIRISNSFAVSDTLHSLDDAISITNDSTPTTTEYESANENDNNSNRMSSCTDVWCDSLLDVKSLKNNVDEDLHERDLEITNKVSPVCAKFAHVISTKSTSDTEGFDCWENLSPTFSWKNNANDRIHGGILVKSSNVLDSSMRTQCRNEGSANCFTVLERLPGDETRTKVEEYLQGLSVVKNINDSYDTIARGEEEELRKVNTSLRNFRSEKLKNCSQNSDFSKRLVRKSNSKRRCEKNRKRYTPKMKPTGYLYDERVFDVFAKSRNDVENNHDEFVRLEKVLANAANRISVIVDEPTSKICGNRVIDFGRRLSEKYSTEGRVEQEAVVFFYNLEIVKSLIWHYMYRTFFEFTYDNVYLYCDDVMGKLHEIFVRRFFANDYTNYINSIVFGVRGNRSGLTFAAELSRRKLADLLCFIDTSRCARERHNVKDEFLFREICHYDIQHDNMNSEIMNCKENVSEAGPATAADIDGISNAHFLNDSSDLDFISKVGGTGVVAPNLRNQSLYVKFDPLVSQEVNSSFSNDDTLKLDTLKLDDSFNRSTNSEAKDNANVETASSNDRNISAEVTDFKTSENNVGKLISVTPGKSPKKCTPKSSPRYTETDPDDVAKLQSLLLKQMKKEEAFKEEIESLKQDYEQVLRKLHNSEQEVSNLKSVLEAVQENEKKLKNELMERIKSKQQLSLIMEEYEKTMSQMVSKRDEEKKEYEATIRKIEAERDNTLQHLNNLENAFNDIHQKYERGKAVNEALKKNEDLLKKSLSDYENTVKTVENKYELLKSHATSQLEKANQELELITQSYEKEQAKLKAMLRKSEIQINSLQNALERKTKENQELTAICDELIVKLSTHSGA